MQSVCVCVCLPCLNFASNLNQNKIISLVYVIENVRLRKKTPKKQDETNSCKLNKTVCSRYTEGCTMLKIMKV